MGMIPAYDAANSTVEAFAHTGQRSQYPPRSVGGRLLLRNPSVCEFLHYGALITDPVSNVVISP